MIKFKTWWGSAKAFAIEDWQSHPLRFCMEMVAWAISIGCSVTYAITVPNLPLIPLYSAFITGCIIASVCAYSRGSFNVFGNYILLAIIDSAGLIKLILMKHGII